MVLKFGYITKWGNANKDAHQIICHFLECGTLSIGSFTNFSGYKLLGTKQILKKEEEKKNICTKDGMITFKSKN